MWGLLRRRSPSGFSPSSTAEEVTAAVDGSGLVAVVTGKWTVLSSLLQQLVVSWFGSYFIASPGSRLTPVSSEHSLLESKNRWSELKLLEEFSDSLRFEGKLAKFTVRCIKILHIAVDKSGGKLWKMIYMLNVFIVLPTINQFFPNIYSSGWCKQ